MTRSDKAIALSETDLKEICKEAVEETFTRLGVDIEEPIEIQKDFSYIRQLRKTTEVVQHKTILAVFGLALSAMAAALWVGIKNSIIS